MCVAKLATGVPVFLRSLYDTRRICEPSDARSEPTRTIHTTATLNPDHVPEISVDRITPDATEHSDRNSNPYSTLVHFAPATFMGVAMIARGEIGLLILQIARGDASNPGPLSEDTFLICTWAILLCTLISPTGVGCVLKYWEKPLRVIWG